LLPRSTRSIADVGMGMPTDGFRAKKKGAEAPFFFFAAETPDQASRLFNAF
jgi:hypothetical protein